MQMMGFSYMKGDHAFQPKEYRKVLCMADLNTPNVQKILNSKAFAHLATIGAKGEPHSSVMWFLWDGEYIKFTHTTERQK